MKFVLDKCTGCVRNDENATHYDEYCKNCNRQLNFPATLDLYESCDGILEIELQRLRKFKSYWDELYGTGLQVANWHQNGRLEDFDNFYDSAMDEYESEE